MLAEHLLLTGSARRGGGAAGVAPRAAQSPLLLGIALAASGGGAMLTFWVYYADPLIGESGAFLFVLGSVAAIAWACSPGLAWEALRPLAVPAALWALASAFVLFLGFLHGGTAEPLSAASDPLLAPASRRQRHPPLYFADYFYAHGHSGPAAGLRLDWLSSDRPPLQIGYVLSQRPFGWDGADLHYEVMGVILQQLWILGIWAVLSAADPAARTRGAGDAVRRWSATWRS